MLRVDPELNKTFKGPSDPLPSARPHLSGSITLQVVTQTGYYVFKTCLEGGALEPESITALIPNPRHGAW